jgi:hypothetical protein
MNFKQFSNYVIRPTLISLSSYSLKPYYSEDVVMLLLATMAQESQGDYLVEVGGDAVSFFQMEPKTFYDLWNSEVKDKALQNYIAKICNSSKIPVHEDMIYNLKLSVIMARLLYSRVEESLPSGTDIEGLWNYYKKYWNTLKGKATQEEFVHNYNKYCKDLHL